MDKGRRQRRHGDAVGQRTTGYGCVPRQPSRQLEEIQLGRITAADYIEATSTSAY